MIAVIETGGKQYTVKIGDVISIEKIPDLTTEMVTFSRVLLTSEGDKTEIGTPFLDISVQGKVITAGRGDKIRVYKMHAKKRYQKTQGHRQDYLKVEITGIGGKTAAKTAPKKEEVAAKKATAKKAPAVKKTAAKKPAVKKTAPKKKV